MSANLIHNDGVEIPAKRRLVVVQIISPSSRTMQKFSAVPDQDFVVAILQDKTCAPDGGLWIPSFGVEILSASHNLLTKTSDGARMATAT
jgi:hypothetical protein